jgi:hypothetical protein
MFTKFLFTAASVALCSMAVVGQKAKAPAAAAASKRIVFAVVGDGSSLEPIAYVNKGKLAEPVNGADAPAAITAFNKSYYKPGTSYHLIFGSAPAGTVKVKSSNAKAECSKNMAEATTSAAKTPLKGLVMGLATNLSAKPGTGTRRKPTTAEKDEIEQLVKDEFVRQKFTPKVLRYHNLTALDVDNDGKVELVGSYWLEVDKTTRALLFFIASKDKAGKFAFGHKEYRTLDQANIMGGEIKPIDEGVQHELLLDALDIDADGTAEIFTYIQSFEGAGFHVYRRNGSKWSQIYEFSNYHCAY